MPTQNDPIPFVGDAELTRIAREGVEALKRQNAARAAYEQAEREYHTHNRNVDGQA
jgi:hypothetical protein